MLFRQSWQETGAVGSAERSRVHHRGHDIVEFSAGRGQAIRIDGRSLLFDPDWYRARYPVPAGQHPVGHYMRTGWRLGHDPNPFFSTRDYLAANPDVAGEILNPFLHYVLYGASQGRLPRADC